MTSRFIQGSSIVWGCYALIALTLSGWVTLASGHNPLWIVICVTGLGTVYGFALLRARIPRWCQQAWLASAVAIFIAFIGWKSTVGNVCFSWIGGFIAGTIFGAWPRLAETKKRSLRDANCWYVGGEKILTSSVAAEQARAKVSSLNGVSRFVLSVSYNKARMDIVGNANNGVAVFCTANNDDKSSWSLLQDNDLNQTAVRLQIGSSRAYLPERNIVSISEAERAMDGFFRYCGPDPGLTWLKGKPAFYRRPPSLE